MLGFDNNGSNSAQKAVLTKNLMILVMIFQQIKCVHVRKWLKTQGFMSIWLQKRRLNTVMCSIEKCPPNRLRISINKITIQFCIYFLNLKTLCALQDKL